MPLSPQPFRSHDPPPPRHQTIGSPQMTIATWKSVEYDPMLGLALRPFIRHRPVNKDVRKKTESLERPPKRFERVAR